MEDSVDSWNKEKLEQEAFINSTIDKRILYFDLETIEIFGVLAVWGLKFSMAQKKNWKSASSEECQFEEGLVGGSAS